jgi:hypothetical protein
MGQKSKAKWAKRLAAAHPPFDAFLECTIEHDKYPPGQSPGLVVRNSRYTVAIWRHRHARYPYLIHLSIKRNDREPIHDWRDLQRIKNELIGAEFEATEIYPAESRLVDCANQYHLYVPADERFQPIRFDYGFNERLVSEETGGAGVFAKAKQRPFENKVRDAVSNNELQRKWYELTQNALIDQKTNVNQQK